MRKFPIPSSPLEKMTEIPRKPSFKNSRSHLVNTVIASNK
jgi:hypothetical protein